MKKTAISFALGFAALVTPLLSLGGLGPPPSIPVTDSWGLVGLSALLAILGVVGLSRRK